MPTVTCHHQKLSLDVSLEIPFHFVIDPSIFLSAELLLSGDVLGIGRNSHYVSTMSNGASDLMLGREI